MGMEDKWGILLSKIRWVACDCVSWSHGLFDLYRILGFSINLSVRTLWQDNNKRGWRHMRISRWRVVEKMPDPEVRLFGYPKILCVFFLPTCCLTVLRLERIECEPNDRLLAASFLWDQDSFISQWNIWMTTRHLDQFWSPINKPKSMESFGSSTFLGNVTFHTVWFVVLDPLIFCRERPTSPKKGFMKSYTFAAGFTAQLHEDHNKCLNFPM